jgi:hypothetical protein
MARSKSDVDWANMPMEQAILHALDVAGADNKDVNGITTDDVAKVLVDLGYPATQDVIAREVCGVAMKYEKERYRQRIHEGKNVNERFVGATWIGARLASEPWNRHQWALPMWAPLPGV